VSVRVPGASGDARVWRGSAIDSCAIAEVTRHAAQCPESGLHQRRTVCQDVRCWPWCRWLPWWLPPHPPCAQQVVVHRCKTGSLAGRCSTSADLGAHRDRWKQEPGNDPAMGCLARGLRADGRQSQPAHRIVNVLAKEEVALVLQGTRERQNFLACQKRFFSSCPLSRQMRRSSSTKGPRRSTSSFVGKSLVFAIASSPRYRRRANGPDQCVESLKQGIRVFVPKKELAFYRSRSSRTGGSQ
jgi:hypothetical protein